MTVSFNVIVKNTAQEQTGGVRSTSGLLNINIFGDDLPNGLRLSVNVNSDLILLIQPAYFFE